MAELTKSAGLYIRVSTERQVEEGYSVAAQKLNLTKFAEDQGWMVYDMYADEGISGKNVEDRPEVQRLIGDIKAGKVNVVVLYKFDRLTRDARDTEDFIKLIQDFGIQVFTLSGGSVDVSTATGRFSVRISGAVAQLEREQTIERVKFAFKQKVEEGYTLATYTQCYGYERKIHEKDITINPTEAKVVKRIFEMYANGKSFTEIAKMLNAEAVPTKLNGKEVKKRGTNEPYVIQSVWMPKTIRLILSNPVYIGKVRYHVNSKDGFVANGNHEPIIDEKLWNTVQERLSKIKRMAKTNLPREDVYYCGTLVCGICGHKLTTNRTNRIKKDGTRVIFNGYRCVNREKGLCPGLGVSHAKVERAFLEYISHVAALTSIKDVEIETDEVDMEELERLKKSLAQVTAKQNEVNDLFIDSKITLDQLHYMTNELKKREDLLSKEIATYESKLTPKKEVDKSKIANTIVEHWGYLSNKERMEFLLKFVKEIVIVNRDKDKVNGKPEILEVKFYEE